MGDVCPVVFSVSLPVPTLFMRLALNRPLNEVFSFKCPTDHVLCEPPSVASVAVAESEPIFVVADTSPLPPLE